MIKMAEGNQTLKDYFASFFISPPPPPPPPPPSPLMEKDWRDIKWGEDETLKSTLKGIKVRSKEVPSLRILVHGPVGAGKSSLINSINSIFQGRMTSAAIAEKPADESFTTIFKFHRIRDVDTRQPLPFVLGDIMGLHKGDSGAHPKDIIKVLNGQIKDGRKLDSGSRCSDTDPDLVSNPTLSDRIHCLVSVVPADTVSFMGEDDFKKMKLIRKQASEMHIPQLVMLTKVDRACPEVQKDIRMIYRSKKIKEKMEQCSNSLGATMNCIFPVRNYHEEIDLNTDVNTLLLSALIYILNFANDHVEDQMPTHDDVDSSSDNQH